MTLLQPVFCITMCPYTIVLSFETLWGILWSDECSLAPENRFFEGLYTFGGSEPQPHQKYTILRKNGFRTPDASHRSRECPGAFQMTILSYTDTLWCKKPIAKVSSVFWAPKTTKSEVRRAMGGYLHEWSFRLKSWFPTEKMFVLRAQTELWDHLEHKSVRK